MVHQFRCKIGKSVEMPIGIHVFGDNRAALDVAELAHPKLIFFEGFPTLHASLVLANQCGGAFQATAELMSGVRSRQLYRTRGQICDGSTCATSWPATVDASPIRYQP